MRSAHRSERLLAHPNILRCAYVPRIGVVSYAFRRLATEEEAIALCEWLDLAPDEDLARTLLESVP